MISTQAPILSKTVRLFIDITAQKQGSSILQFDSISAGNVTIGTTTSLIFEVLYTTKFTIDFDGIISVINIALQLISNNSSNGVLKLQISGDAGSTWTDLTGEVSGVYNVIQNVGQWITNVSVGTDGLQFRVLGKSTDGAAANIIIVENQVPGQGDSFLDVMFSKEII